MSRPELRKQILENQPELLAYRGGFPFGSQPLAQTRITDLADQIVDG
jgi:hypothetical protein